MASPQSSGPFDFDSLLFWALVIVGAFLLFKYLGSKGGAPALAAAGQTAAAGQALATFAAWSPLA